MRPQDIALVQKSIRDLLPVADEAADAFLQLLMLSSPRWQRMLGTGAGRRGLLAGFVFVIETLDDLELMRSGLGAVGARCRAVGIGASERSDLGAVLVEVLADFLGPRWTPELAAAWREAIRAVGGVIDEAAGKDRAAA